MMDTIPVFDLTRTVAAQPPDNAKEYIARCGEQIAWLDHHDETDHTRGTAVHGAMSAYIKQFPLAASILLEVYIRTYTRTRRHLRNTSTLHTREDCCAS